MIKAWEEHLHQHHAASGSTGPPPEPLKKGKLKEALQQDACLDLHLAPPSKLIRASLHLDSLAALLQHAHHGGASNSIRPDVSIGSRSEESSAASVPAASAAASRGSSGVERGATAGVRSTPVAGGAQEPPQRPAAGQQHRGDVQLLLLRLLQQQRQQQQREEQRQPPGSGHADREGMSGTAV